jgi:hypothetical protein
LDLEKTIDINLFFGASQGVGRLAITTQISSGDEVVAVGESKTHLFTPGAPYPLLTWNLEPLTDTIQGGTNLTWTIKASGTASSGFIGVAPEQGQSNLTLPILSVIEQNETTPVTYKDISNESIEERLVFVNATTAQYVYNWTMNGTNGAGGNMTIQGAGMVGISATDGNGTEVWNITNDHDTAAGESGARNRTIVPLDAPGGAPGNWTINLTVGNFTGSIDLAVAPMNATPAKPSPTFSTTPKSSPKTTSSSASEAAAPKTGTDEARGTPATGFLLGLMAACAAALAKRRKPSA